MNAWTESCGLDLSGLTGEQIVERAKKHYPTFKGMFVTQWNHKSDKNTAFNIDAFERGMLRAVELYHMSRPFAFACNVEDYMRHLRGLPADGPPVIIAPPKPGETNE